MKVGRFSLHYKKCDYVCEQVTLLCVWCLYVYVCGGRGRGWRAVGVCEGVLTCDFMLSWCVQVYVSVHVRG